MSIENRGYRRVVKSEVQNMAQRILKTGKCQASTKLLLYHFLLMLIIISFTVHFLYTNIFAASLQRTINYKAFCGLLNESHPRVFQTRTLPLLRTLKARLVQVKSRKISVDQTSLVQDFERSINPGVILLQVIANNINACLS